MEELGVFNPPYTVRDFEKNVMQNGQNSVAGSEGINGGMSGIIEKLIKSVKGNVS